MNRIILTSSLTLSFYMLNAQEKQPNIIVFIADDWGWEDSGAYGNPAVRTPNIDRLAKEGMKFNNFYLTASSSSPSRSSLLSGLYPHNTGAMNLHEDMSPNILLFPEILKENGYYTMIVGKSHGTNHPGVKKKFDKIVLSNTGKPWKMGDSWVDALKSYSEDKPFFMWAATNDPHRPYKQGVYTNPHNPKEVIVPPYIPDIPGVREDLADYYDEVSRFDEHIGLVLKALEEKNILDNTIIIVMTDNGRPFMQCKTRVNNQGLKSPFIVRYPPLVKPGIVTNSLASAVDLAPTLLELVGAKKPKVMQGFSLVPVLKSPDREIRKYAFGEHNWHVLKAFERAVITKEYVYIKNWLSEYSNPPVNETIAMPVYQEIYQMWKNGELKKQYTDCFISPRPSEELFDIRNDIHCMNNLSKKKNKKEMKDKLENILDAWQQSTGDVFPGDVNLQQDRCDRVTGVDFVKK